MKKRNSTPINIVKMDSEGKSEAMPDQEEGLRAAFSDLAAAVHSGDKAAGARALKAAFQICESYPHEEGLSVEE